MASRILLVSLLLVCVSAVSAQTAPNVAGQWTLTPSKTPVLQCDNSLGLIVPNEVNLFQTDSMVVVHFFTNNNDNRVRIHDAPPVSHSSGGDSDEEYVFFMLDGYTINTIVPFGPSRAPARVQGTVSSDASAATLTFANQFNYCGATYQKTQSCAQGYPNVEGAWLFSQGSCKPLFPSGINIMQCGPMAYISTNAANVDPVVGSVNASGNVTVSFIHSNDRIDCNGHTQDGSINLTCPLGLASCNAVFNQA